MLCVAFSRRMCCSRVWSVSTKPRLPSTSRVSPAIRPGILRMKRSSAAKKPNEGPPKSSRLPSVWPSPTQRSTPSSPGGFRIAERDRVGGAHEQRAGALAGLGQRAEVLDGAQEVRLLHEHGGGVVVDGRRERLEVGLAVVVERHLHDLHAVARRVRRERRARVRVEPAARHQLRPLRLELRQVAGGGHSARALVHRGVRHRQAGELRDRGLELEHHLEPALRDLGLVGRVRRQELRARQQRVDQRRHVVVVHAGPEEGDLLLGAAVAAGERGEVLVDLLLGAAGREVELAAEPDRLRDVREQLLQRAGADRAEHRLQVLVCDSGVAAHPGLYEPSYPFGAAPCTPPRPSAGPPPTGRESLTLTIQPSP